MHGIRTQGCRIEGADLINVAAPVVGRYLRERRIRTHVERVPIMN